jgi:hypothetical protein
LLDYVVAGPPPGDLAIDQLAHDVGVPGVSVQLGEHMHEDEDEDEDEDEVQRDRSVAPSPDRAGRVDGERLDCRVRGVHARIAGR